MNESELLFSESHIILTINGRDRVSVLRELHVDILMSEDQSVIHVLGHIVEILQHIGGHVGRSGDIGRFRDGRSRTERGCGGERLLFD